MLDSVLSEAQMDEYLERLFLMLEEKERSSAKGHLADEQTTLLHVYHAIGVLDNGGIEYAIRNGIDPREYAKDFERIQDDEVAKILKKAAVTFTDDELDRWFQKADAPGIFSGGRSDVLELLSDQYFDLSGSRIDKVRSFVREHIESFDKVLDVKKFKETLRLETEGRPNMTWEELDMELKRLNPELRHRDGSSNDR